MIIVKEIIIEFIMRNVNMNEIIHLKLLKAYWIRVMVNNDIMDIVLP
jgi:hypothetical protein